MKYSHAFRTALILVGLLGLSGCGLAPEESGSGRWKAGVHYEVLPDPPLRDPGGRIQVVEFFWYGCGHCYLLEPHLVLWNRRKPGHVEFVRIPTQGRPVSQAHARLFYTLKALDRLDLHPLVFDAIQHEGKLLETERAQREFLAPYGVRDEDFATACRSPEVERALAEADKTMRSYRVAAVPTVLIGGRFRTDLIRAGGNTQLIELISTLVADE